MKAAKQFRPSHVAKRRESDLPSRQAPRRAEYHTTAWRRLRERVIERDCYLCQECKRQGRLTVVALHAKRGTRQTMAVVDHVVPAMTAADVLCDENNLQTLCSTCASRKTSRTDGGYGNPTGGWINSLEDTQSAEPR